MGERGKNKSLFTFVCEFRGGTYVSQVRAANMIAAIHEWVSLFNDKEPDFSLSTDLAQTVLRSLDEFPPAPLNELRNVWCITADCGGFAMLVNIVRTADLSSHED